MALGKKDSIRFLTLNVYEGGLLFPNIMDFITKNDPDIMVFQEVYNGKEPSLQSNYRTMDVLTSAFPHYFSIFAPEFLCVADAGEIDVGNATFSKYPIRHEKTIFVNAEYGKYPEVSPNKDWSKYPQNLLVTAVDILGTELRVGNIHGIWGFHGDDTVERLQMAETILTTIGEKNPFILAGDFNLNPNTQTVKKIETRLHNVFGTSLKTSFNLQRKDLVQSPGYATSAVDMIFVSSDIDVETRNCPQVDVSDHLPLLMDFHLHTNS